ncbi:unnamed protein product [Medioppia subpectinata]|uniref:J domain-containing protein n=1 Tax=Medioppia subpectinata TaxID=1979941 RepID=A0A7R9Q888_9ACAR|nr:unnamed protein product [Medioppia subpectinata]CAG2116528.1 unnamed protein product [Medioppia subpectinata]
MDNMFEHKKNSSKEDYYQTLGCDYSSSLEQITCEYKSRALVLHPDKQNNKESDESFKQLVKAKEILTDPQKRKQYDRWRTSGIDITFEEWNRLGKGVHTSMHWRNDRQKDPMIGNGVSDANHSVCSSGVKFPINWSRDSNNQTLNKFRNYQI